MTMNHYILFSLSILIKLLFIASCIIGSLGDEVNDFHYGILKARAIETKNERKYCLGYYPTITKIPVPESEVKYSNLYNDIIYNLCDGEFPPPGTNKGEVIYAQRHTNCSLVAQALEAESNGASGTIFIGGEWPKSVNASNGTSVHMGLLTNTSYRRIWEFGLSENSSIQLGAYASASDDEFYFNYNLIVIWVIAEFSIIVGAYWSGIVRHRLFLGEQGETVGNEAEALPETGSNYVVKEESSLKLSPKVIFILVTLMCIMMVCLWFLLQYLVYIIIALFCLASFVAVYCCLEPLVLKIPCGKCRTPYFNLYLIRGVLEIRQVILILFAAALPIIWFVFRRNNYAWILQDLLGIAFSINVMRVIRLPNLMICTLLLSLLVLYDIFFVFITPFITSSGTSIMVDVVSTGGNSNQELPTSGTSIMVDVSKGGNSNEELPMVFKVPYFIYPEYYDVCGIKNFSMLGFGDILVPGLLVSYVHSFDLRVGTPFRLYYLVNVVAYGIGLLLTFLVLYLMRGAQPALVYLVPCTLIPTVIIAAARGELALMWTNKPFSEKNNSDLIEDYPPVQNDAGSETSSHSDEEFHNEEDGTADKASVIDKDK